jgi:tRNA(Ile)-lysidine synthase
MGASRSRPSPDGNLPGQVAACLAAARVAPGQRLCVALSGGVDSVVLTCLLAELRKAFNFTLSACHVHHGLSPHADDWLAYCARLCARLEIPFEGHRVSVPGDSGSGLEAAARAERHAVLGAVPADWLVFAHHLDDQAETLLFRLARGTGLRGAGCMRAVDRTPTGRPCLRPLLTVRRAQIEAWARARGLEWVEDESNADLSFARNRLRHVVLPELGQVFAHAPAALARAAGHFQEASDLLDELAAIDAAACGVPMRRVSLAALPVARASNLLRWLVRGLGFTSPPRVRLAEALRQLEAAAPNTALYLPLGGGAVCCAFRDRCWVEGEDGAAYLPVRWQGAQEHAWGRGVVRFRGTAGAGLDQARLGQALEVALVPRWPGLRMRQHAGGPHRSLKNLCQEAGIPPWMRARLPVLRVDGAAAWIGGIGLAAGFACAPTDAGLEPEWNPAAPLVRAG